MIDNLRKQSRCVIAGALAVLIMLAMSVWHSANGTPSAPAAYPAVCAACGHEYRITQDAFTRITFARMHPRQYREQYPGEPCPLGQQCSACGAIHNDLMLATSPRTGKRFVLLRDGSTPSPASEEALAAVSPF